MHWSPEAIKLIVSSILLVFARKGRFTTVRSFSWSIGKCVVFCISTKEIFVIFEKLYSIRAFKAIRRADVVVFVIDCLAGVVDQDRLLAKRIVEEGRSCIIALNKWDAVPNKDDKSYLSVTAHIRQELPELKFAEVFLLSFH
jgi:hypothetical protein